MRPYSTLYVPVQFFAPVPCSFVVRVRLTMNKAHSQRSKGAGRGDSKQAERSEEKKGTHGRKAAGGPRDERDQSSSTKATNLLQQAKALAAASAGAAAAPAQVATAFTSRPTRPAPTPAFPARAPSAAPTPSHETICKYPVTGILLVHTQKHAQSYTGTVSNTPLPNLFCYPNPFFPAHTVMASIVNAFSIDAVLAQVGQSELAGAEAVIFRNICMPTTLAAVHEALPKGWERQAVRHSVVPFSDSWVQLKRDKVEGKLYNWAAQPNYDGPCVEPTPEVFQDMFMEALGAGGVYLSDVEPARVVSESVQAITDATPLGAPLLGQDLPGVNKEMVYIHASNSEQYTLFPIHVEDAFLAAMSLLVAGLPKAWVVIPARFWPTLVNSIIQEVPPRDCSNPLSHKCFLPASLSALHAMGITPLLFMQYPGDLMVTLPGAAHFGFSFGPNASTAINVTTPNWHLFYPRAQSAGPCRCVPPVELDLEALAVAYDKAGWDTDAASKCMCTFSVAVAGRLYNTVLFFSG